MEEIGDYIARDNPARAVEFVEALEARCHAIAATPAAFPLRDDIAEGIRMAVHRRYLIFFRVQPNGPFVRIERVLHGARHLSGEVT